MIWGTWLVKVSFNCHRNMERESLRDRTLFIINSFCLYIYFFFTFFGMAGFCGIVIITLSYFLIRKIKISMLNI